MTLLRMMLSAATGMDNDHKSHALSDLNMLRGPGGMERTEAQYRDLLESAGFRTTSIVPAGRFNVIEAKPA